MYKNVVKHSENVVVAVDADQIQLCTQNKILTQYFVPMESFDEGPDVSEYIYVTSQPPKDRSLWQFLLLAYKACWYTCNI